MTRKRTIPIPHLPRELDGLKILQISDLHYSPYVRSSFLNKITKRIQKLSPDIIVFTGDLISYSTMPEKSLQLEQFLKSLLAPLGTFFVYGNHDYQDYVSLGKDGRFHKVESHIPVILRGFARLFQVKDNATEGPIISDPVPENAALKELLQRSGVQLLHNETVKVGKKGALINITGLGDYMTGHCMPFEAFKNYNPYFAGIVLSHNPDSYSLLENFPGDLFLFGHTHGGQVNLPFLWKRVTPLKNKKLKSGLFHLHESFQERYLYVNRGLGATFPFRWFAPPEITLFTLTREGAVKTPLIQRLFPQESPLDAASCTP